MSRTVIACIPTTHCVEQLNLWLEFNHNVTTKKNNVQGLIETVNSALDASRLFYLLIKFIESGINYFFIYSKELYFNKK